MLKTIILLTGAAHQQRALCALLALHNPALSFRVAMTHEDLAAITPEVWPHARLVSFTTGTIVPASMLKALGHGAYNFHPGPPGIRAPRASRFFPHRDHRSRLDAEGAWPWRL